MQREIAGACVEKFGEHAMRVSGAQFFAKKGYELFVIQLLGRWGSMAVSRYVQTAPLASSSLGKRESCSTADVIALIRQHTAQSSEDKVDPKTNEQLEDIQKKLVGLGESLQILQTKAAKATQSEPDKLVKNTVSGKTHLVLVELSLIHI